MTPRSPGAQSITFNCTGLGWAGLGWAGCIDQNYIYLAVRFLVKCYIKLIQTIE